MKLNELLTFENTLIIAPSEKKKKLLRLISDENNLYQVKIMSKEEFIQYYYFTYDERTVAYCFENYDYSYEIILEYLNILPFIVKDKYVSSKLNFLVKLKKELAEKKLLKTEPFFREYLKKAKIIVYGYSEIEPFYQKILSNYLDVVYYYPEVIKKELVVYEANHIDDEINFILSKIKKLILSGVKTSNIHLMNVKDEYLNPLYRLSKWFNIPIKINEAITLWDLPIGKKIYNLLVNGSSFSEVISYLDDENIGEEYYNLIVDVLNSYLFLSDSYKKRNILLKEVFKHTNIRKKETMGIDCVNLSDTFDDDYYFLLGMNQENIPKIDKGEGILSDSISVELDLFTSNEKNKLEKQRVKDILYQTNNLVLTYKNKTSFQSYNPSLLIEEENMVVDKIELDFNSSNSYNQVKFINYLDLFHRYGKCDDNITSLYNKNLYGLYRSYQNKFNGISQESLFKRLNGKLLLSYSSLDNYYRCSFRYYLSNLLKIEKFESTFYTNIGNIFHSILSKCFNSEFNFEDEFEKELSNYEFKINETFLLGRLKKELKLNIEMIKNQMNLTHFDKALYEKKFYLSIPTKYQVDVTMMGIIDKILYLPKNNKTYISIIDYKTGYLPDHLDTIIHGIGMQLPIYYYLVKRSNYFDSVKIVGIFLQKIINQDLKKDKNESYLEKKEKSLKLVGYATSNEDELEEFDISYHDSALIKSMKVGNNGFYKYARVLNDYEFSKMDEIVEKKIQDATDSILMGDFKINPKRIGKENVGCSFCPYKDICFYQEEDIVDLVESKNLDFLRGGDKDAELD